MVVQSIEYRLLVVLAAIAGFTPHQLGIVLACSEPGSAPSLCASGKDFPLGPTDELDR